MADDTQPPREEIVVYGRRKASKGVELFVGGAVYSQWTQVEITRSIETIAGTFSLTLTQPAHNSSRRGDVTTIKPGASCKVKVDGETVITGWVDDVSVGYDKQSHTIGVTGRDATGDLVDCSLRNIDGNVTAQDPLAVIQRICAPFGVNVRSTVAPLPPLLSYTMEPGATAFESIDQIAGFAAVLPVSDGLGGIELTHAGTGPSFAPLTIGDNIEAGRGRFSFKDRFSDYLVISQYSASGGATLHDSYAQMAEVKDPGVGRYRPLTLIANFVATDGDLQRRAQWEFAVRAGRAYREDITVKGWRDDSGQLWVPNGTVTVTDPFVGFAQKLVVAAVSYRLSESGTTTVLSVAPHQAFDLISKPLGDGFASPAQPQGATK